MTFWDVSPVKSFRACAGPGGQRTARTAAEAGYLARIGRNILFLGVHAVGVAVSTLLAGLVTYGHHALAFRMLAQLLAALANVGLYGAGFRVLTPRAACHLVSCSPAR